MAGRILDEVIHDLTPYGYKPIADKVYVKANGEHSIGTFDVDRHSIDGYTHTDAPTMENKSSPIDKDVYDEMYKASDVVADIVLNYDTIEAKQLGKHVEKFIPGGIIREIATSDSVQSRRMMLLERKSLTRYTKAITKIVIEGNFDMSIKKDKPFDMTIKGDRKRDMSIETSDVERFIIKLKKEKTT